MWSPRGDRVAYSSNASGTHDIFVKPAGGGREELLLASEHEKIVSDWSADGGFLLFDTRDLNKRSDIWALPLRKGGQPFPVVETNFEEQRAQFSPDGNWIAYQSDQSGRQEVYVQPFRGGGAKRLVSTNGGSQVRWRRDGKELFYVDPDGRLMAVPINLATSGPAPQVEKPTALFAPPLGSAVQRGDFRHRYMVSNDGRRFLVAVISGDTGTSSITVILNWKPRA